MVIPPSTAQSPHIFYSEPGAVFNSADIVLPEGESVFKVYPQLTTDAIRQMCIERFDFFCAFVLKYEVHDFHIKMMEHRLIRRRSLVLAGRGFGKSTILDVAWLLWKLVQMPNVRVCIASKTGDQAKAFLGEIKAHMERNDDFIAIFGNMRGNLWNENEITIATRTKIKKEPTITAVGAGAGIPGRHFDIIIGDDIVDEANSATPHQRDALRKWFYLTLSPTLEPDEDAEFHIIGTRWNPDDLYGKLAKKDKQTGEYADEDFGPNVCVIPAIYVVQDEEGKSVEKSQWEVKFPVKTLQKIRRNMGIELFNLGYQNKAEITEGGIIKLENLEPYMWKGISTEMGTCYGGLGGLRPPDEELIIFQGVDPAISLKQTADFFVHVTIGVSILDNHIYVLEVIKGRFTLQKQVEIIIGQNEKWNPRKIGIESIAYQQALVQAVLGEVNYLPVLEVRPRKDKTQRATVFSAFTERHEIHLHIGDIEMLECLVMMPSPEDGHDDLFDGIDIATEAAKTSVLAGTVVARVPNRHRRR